MTPISRGVTCTIPLERVHNIGTRIGAVAMVAVALACSDPEPPIVPWPTSLTTSSGELALTANSRIIVEARELDRLESVLVEEVRLATGLELGIGRDARAGDIVLDVDPQLPEEQYTLTVDTVARVSGGSYGAVALGTTTLLQAMRATAEAAVVPNLRISDQPHSAYRGLLVDLARNWHSVETLEQIIVMCRLYKIRYLHLHLTDNQSFTFPTLSYPELPTPGRHYSAAELEALERFAADRGVTLVPELEIPGHSFSLVSALPDIFGIADLSENPYVINMGSEGVYTALERIIGEIADIFISSPYFHIGGDETWLAYLDQDPPAIEYMRRNGISSVNELYRHFIVRVNEIVKRHGKTTIVWEGFHKEGEIEIPRDILVMAWETAYQLPQDLLESGYTVINVSWKPLYVVRNRRWSPEHVYDWNMYRWENWYSPTPSFVPIQLEPNEDVIGAQMAAWEQPEVMEVPSLRERLPVFSERVWNPSIQRGFADLSSRFAATDLLLQRLIRPATVEIRGQKHPGYSGPFFNRENWFADSLTVVVSPLRDDYLVFYSMDTTAAPATWSPYSEPLRLGETTTLWLRVDDGSGNSVGYPWRTDYEFRPLTLAARGLAALENPDPASEPSVFHEELSLSLRSDRSGGSIRYTLDGEAPGSSSPVYQEPILLSESATLVAQYFGDDGTPTGEPLRKEFRKVEFLENLTTGKRVTASIANPEHPSLQLIVDGMVDLRNYWGTDAATSTPWFQVDLGELHDLHGAELFTYWDGERYYRYTVDVSTDGDEWTRVVDTSNNTTPATIAGYSHQFAEATARFVRVTLLENSANSWVHVVEFRVH